MTLNVSDISAYVAEVESRGITIGDPDDTTSEKVIFLAVADPERRRRAPS